MRFDPTSMMGNTPAAQLIRMLQSGGNPNTLIEQAINSNPQLKQIAGGKSPEQLMRVAQNMCRERRTNVDDVLRSLGIQR